MQYLVLIVVGLVLLVHELVRLTLCCVKVYVQGCISVKLRECRLLKLDEDWTKLLGCLWVDVVSDSFSLSYHLDDGVPHCHGSGSVAHLAQVTHLAGKFHLHCFLVCYGNCRCLMTQHLSGCL